MKFFLLDQSSNVWFSCCAAHWYLACFIFCVNRGFVIGLHDFRPCSRGRLLMVLLSTATLSLSNYIKSILHEALLFFNAIALIFRSSLGVVFHLRPHFPPWTVNLSSQFQCLSYNTNSFELIHLIPWLCLSVLSHCAWVKQWFVLFFWDSNLYSFLSHQLR